MAVLRRDGWATVTARSIAQEMGASTMPIYSQVQSMKHLEADLRLRVRTLLVSYQTRMYTDQVLLNAALGYVRFARDEPRLFRFHDALYGTPLGALDEAALDGAALDEPAQNEADPILTEPATPYTAIKNSFLRDFGDASPQARALKELEQAHREDLLFNSWVYTHGLASLLSEGALGDWDDATLLAWLRSAGEAFASRGYRSESED